MDFYEDLLTNDAAWRAATRQMVRLLVHDGYSLQDALVETIRVGRVTRGWALEELRDLATEV